MKKASTKFRWIMWAVLIGGGIVLSLLTDFYLRKSGFHASFGIIGRAIGLILIVLSMIISRNTGKTLAKYGRKGNIPKLETNVLVRNGVYSCMRHPMHLGLMLMPFGIAFLMNSFSYVCIYAPLTTIVILVMIKTIEEKEALAKFGISYEKYMREVPAFNFSPQCIKKLFQCCK